MFSIHFLEKSPMSAIMAICRISLLASIRPLVLYSNFSPDETVTCFRMAPGVEMQLNCPNTSAVLSRHRDWLKDEQAGDPLRPNKTLVSCNKGSSF